jgi:hypothetical protein
MIPDQSTVIRKLTEDEITILSSELENNLGLYMQHPMSRTALRGQSIIVNWVTKIKGHYQLQWTHRERFPESWKIFEKIADGKAIGKVYWHWLPAGGVAGIHHDHTSDNPYIIDGNAFQRLNVFLKIPDGVTMFFDGNFKAPFDTSSLEHTLFNMSAHMAHAVYNNSNQDFHCMVIDILNPGIPIESDLYMLDEKYNQDLARLR